MRITEEQLVEIERRGAEMWGVGHGFYSQGIRETVEQIRRDATPDDPPFQPGDVVRDKDGGKHIVAWCEMRVGLEGYAADYLADHFTLACGHHSEPGPYCRQCGSRVGA